jgi:hypothetical protein
MKKDGQNRPVLVLGASPRISLSVARSLHNHRVPVEVAPFQPEEPEVRSRKSKLSSAAVRMIEQAWGSTMKELEYELVTESSAERELVRG